MAYITIDTVNQSLGEHWHDNSDANLCVMLANSWLKSKNLPAFVDAVPDDVLMAGAMVAQAIAKKEMLAGRSEGVVKSKSVQAGDVSSSKTFVDGENGQAISKSEQQALLLIQPYIREQHHIFVGLERY